ncbi:hypothetical protein J3R30DRAFT_149038 [Lentinula aciculospora]|uniref:AIG1-type G domain-containing protein n=1 Tax=Lentinula aciculospora TaxID=153920 RepID=A0A9W9AJ09_9AGAR|nr:hypothetical protein J3R30DRAFT_1854890 [Lentinula aciculospora]KAJ4490884.1 hypothetical protein J3R30DRAFT_149038 [Lentinula aciculospora]
MTRGVDVATESIYGLTDSMREKVEWKSRVVWKPYLRVQLNAIWNHHQLAAPLLLMSKSATLQPIDASIVPNTTTTTAAAAKPDVNPTTKRMTIQPPWNKRQINLILIGETGVGKTALLDLLANVCAGVELEDFKAIHHAASEQGGSSSGSQTNVPVFYSIPCADGSVVNILDTPGLADTRGIDMDNQHKAAIANAIKKHLGVVDGVIIIANGTVEKLNAPTEYALTTISGMFPHSIIDNIIFIFTMVSDPTSFNFDRSSLEKQLQKSKIWSINNPYAQWMKYQKRLAQDPPTLDEEILAEMNDSVHKSYVKVLKTLGQVFQYLDKCKVQPTNSIYNLYIMTTDIEASISNVIARMDQTEITRNELKRLQNDKDVQEQSKKINEKYKEIINTAYYEHEATGSEHNTLCVAGNCYKNCHEGCGVGFTIDRASLGDNCSAFYNSTGSGLKRLCTICHHLAEDHQHYRSKWVRKTKIDEVVDEVAEARYKNAKSEAERISISMEGVQKTIEGLEKDIVGLEKELSELCDKYNELALSGSFIGYISSAIRLLMLRQVAMTKEGADADSLGRMADRIARLEHKKKVLEEAEKLRSKKLASFLGF